ncbi:hypothetical protein N9S66_00575 [bacterium]|jgi:serine/threonine protein kinase|nr:hypothetical protein [bacterium]|tara:strand:+ start:12110 stop:13408 length:1299 start_codon:yes stop_codon:yes gene_type:complete
MGIVLATEDGTGAYVEDIVQGGYADVNKCIDIGDIIAKIEVQGGLIDCENMQFDALLSLLGNRQEVRLEVRRPTGQKTLGTTTDAAAVYWEKKRQERTSGKKILRRTFGVEPGDISVSKNGPLSQGNFGVVFNGTWKGSDVILKTSRANVLWADDLLDIELEMNEIVHKRAKGTCAKFLGCCEIDFHSEGQLYNGSLPAGLWLMWQNQGLSTLGSLYEYADSFLIETLNKCVRSSADASKHIIIKSFLKNLALKLAKLHSVGIVHRDVKPDNILLTEDGPVFIDLGASASCLTNLINYYPGSGPADPLFSVQTENFLIPEDAPRPTDKNAAKLWDEYKPDRFDAFSLGVILLQLCIEPLRDKDNLRNFIRELETCDLDLYVWRSASRYPLETFSLLERDSGSGWDLASSLVCARHARLSLADTTSHRFFDEL